MRTLKLSLVLSATCFVNPIWFYAQSSSCSLPLVVTRFNPERGGIELVTELAAKDFSITVGGSRAIIKSVSVDDGSKRIALILDASRKVLNDEWKFEAQMALSFVENARAVDKFSLSLVGVGNTASAFVAPGDLQTQLRSTVSSRPEATDDKEKIYAALVEAARRFDPPAFGDTIFVFGHPDDSGSQASLEQAEEMILRNRLRFYALSFTDPLAGKLPRNFDLNKPLPKKAILGGADDIAHATGYFVSYPSVEVLRRFPDQTRLLQGFLEDEYAGITQPYKLEVSPGPSARTPLELTILNGKERNINPSDVHYRRFIYPCTSK